MSLVAGLGELDVAAGRAGSGARRVGEQALLGRRGRGVDGRRVPARGLGGAWRALRAWQAGVAARRAELALGAAAALSRRVVRSFGAG